MKISKPEYIKKAVALSHDEQQRILSRMTGKLPKRLIKEKLSVDEAIAIQLEIEEEQLKEWRKNWDKIRKQGTGKELNVTSKAVAKTATSKPTVVGKTPKPASVKSATSEPATVKTTTTKTRRTTKATN